MKAFFTFGRFQPPTIGHLRIVNKLRKIAKREGVPARLYLSETHDNDRNPIDPLTKLNLVKKIFPDMDVRLSKTIFTASLEMASEGFDEAVIIVGKDRQKEFSKTLKAYSGTPALGLKINVQSISRTDDDVSATEARLAVKNNKFIEFAHLTPSNDDVVVHELYEAVRLGLENDG